MTNTTRLAGLLAAAVLAMPASAETHDITQVNLTWSPNQLTVAPGDTIRFHWSAGNHTVTTGEGCVFGGDEVIIDTPLSSATPLVEMVIPSDIKQSAIPFFCRPHCTFNMIGVIEVEFPPPPCPGDFDLSGDVGFGDLVSLLGLWGPCPGCPEDIDLSGDVGFADLVALLAAWGPCA